MILYEELFDAYTNFDKQKIMNKKEINKHKREFCNKNSLVYRTFEQSIKEYRELKNEIKSRVNYLNVDLKMLLEKDEAMSKEKHEIKIQKCFFSTYFENLSRPLTQSKLI